MSQKIIYLIPSHLSDNPKEGVLSPYSQEIIKNVSHYFAEEVRTARRFISSLKLGVKIDDLTFFELTKDSRRRPILEILYNLPSNVTEIGVLSEAGSPGIADPGALLVGIAQEKGWKVVPVPGPSSLFLSLMGSGFNGQQFHFHGYLPIKSEDRIRVMKKIEENVLSKGTTHLFIETPFRNESLLKDLLLTLQPSTFLCIASDLTSAEEFIVTKTVQQWRSKVPEIRKIPTVFLIGIPGNEY